MTDTHFFLIFYQCKLYQGEIHRNLKEPANLDYEGDRLIRRKLGNMFPTLPRINTRVQQPIFRYLFKRIQKSCLYIRSITVLL